MICYKCGCTLSEKDFCTGCGADVGMYKRILAASNRYYNDALEKASVRDLSGAIISLKQSLKLNKNNVEARNLLGLIYYEIGEVVEAIGQWVISNNIRDTKNIAADYLADLQESPTKLDGLNQNLKKFNHSLELCYNDSLDLAKIQLKKILSVEPKYLRAHQLLALIYIKDEEWDKAEKELEKCAAIDAKNITTMRYMQEIKGLLEPEENTGKKDKNKTEVRVYQSGNETIIQPVNKSESRALSVFFNILIGIAVGVAIALFLILPGRIQAAKADVNDELRVVSEASDSKTATIDELELQVSKLGSENESLKEELASYVTGEGNLASSDALMSATVSYYSNPEDIETIATYLEMLEKKDSESEETRSDSFMSLYNHLIAKVGPSLATYYYEQGFNTYKAENYEDAIPDLYRAYEYDHANGDALFYLANAYRKVGDDTSAKEYYAEVIDNFPDTERAAKAETYLAEINNQE
ncbi:MAG: tetratricopeptide repeat protein [Lachnospiraceae bacterium]|nr:tetratricopeptide repeat protein [Lachnospiraceae bacterium]